MCFWWWRVETDFINISWRARTDWWMRWRRTRNSWWTLLLMSWRSNIIGYNAENIKISCPCVSYSGNERGEQVWFGYLDTDDTELCCITVVERWEVWEREHQSSLERTSGTYNHWHHSLTSKTHIYRLCIFHVFYAKAIIIVWRFCIHYGINCACNA